jgi:hypothetical protein
MADRLSAGSRFLIGSVHFSGVFRIAKYSILNIASSVKNTGGCGEELAALVHRLAVRERYSGIGER